MAGDKAELVESAARSSEFETTSKANSGAPGDEVGVALESVLRTDELKGRPSRPPDYEVENRALVALAQSLADSPRTILAKLTDKILEVLKVGSAGISLLSQQDGGSFYWPAIAGAWKENIGGTMPFDASPCGVVVERDASQLFVHPERLYRCFVAVTAPIVEALLCPFHVNGRTAGTIWAISHDEQRKFDAEDLRELEGLARFASAAYQTADFVRLLEDSRRDAVNVMQDAVHCRERADALNEQLLTEVTERRRAEEELRQADRRKDDFLAMLAHELRNPLAPIRNFVQIMKVPGVNADLVSQARNGIDRQVQHLSRLVDDLLDVSRIMRGLIELRREPVDLAMVFSRALEIARPLMDARGHQVEVDLSPPSIVVEGDVVRLAQVVGNLLVNAGKYTDQPGCIQLTGRLEGAEAVIQVRDPGVGIAPELMPRLFDLFVQADRSLARSQGGLGVGLTLVKHLVELHGGTVTAASAGLGQGSKFTVRLPQTPARTPRAER